MRRTAHEKEREEETTVLKNIQRRTLEYSTRTNTQTPHPLVDLSVVMAEHRPNALPDTSRAHSRTRAGAAPIKRKHLNKREEETTVLKRIQRRTLEYSTRTITQTPHPLIGLSVVMAEHRPNIAPDTTRTRVDGKTISRNRTPDTEHKSRSRADKAQAP